MRKRQSGQSKDFSIKGIYNQFRTTYLKSPTSPSLPNSVQTPQARPNNSGKPPLIKSPRGLKRIKSPRSYIKSPTAGSQRPPPKKSKKNKSPNRSILKNNSVQDTSSSNIVNIVTENEELLAGLESEPKMIEPEIVYLPKDKNVLSQGELNISKKEHKKRQYLQAQIQMDKKDYLAIMYSEENMKLKEQLRILSGDNVNLTEKNMQQKDEIKNLKN